MKPREFLNLKLIFLGVTVNKLGGLEKQQLDNKKHLELKINQEVKIDKVKTL